MKTNHSFQFIWVIVKTMVCSHHEAGAAFFLLLTRQKPEAHFPRTLIQTPSAGTCSFPLSPLGWQAHSPEALELGLLTDTVPIQTSPAGKFWTFSPLLSSQMKLRRLWGLMISSQSWSKRSQISSPQGEAHSWEGSSKLILSKKILTLSEMDNGRQTTNNGWSG